jgi:AraC-like DNA-binding protein
MSYLYQHGFLHVLANARRCLNNLGLIEFGYFPNKPFILTYDCATLNFSFLISGEGNYQINGKKVFVKAPCVLVQKPNDHCQYGPLKNGKWEEFYFIYDPKEQVRYKASNLLNESEIYWPIHNLFAVESCILALTDAIDSNQPADVIEQLCETLLITSKMPKQANYHDKVVSSIRDLATSIKSNCSQTLNFNAVAEQLGLSYSSFRRSWMMLYGVSPKTYQIDVRITKAANLLISTDMPVSVIAEEVGYSDPAYFSTLFKKRYTQNPVSYRKSYFAVLPSEYDGPTVSSEQETDIEREQQVYS